MDEQKCGDGSYGEYPGANCKHTYKSFFPHAITLTYVRYGRLCDLCQIFPFSKNELRPANMRKPSQ